MCNACKSPVQSIPVGHLTWSVTLDDNNKLNYGQMHEIFHRDIAIGNDYRKERIKLLVALATGIFALAVTFHKDVFGSVLTYPSLGLMLGGLILLIVSLGAGIVHFRKWEDFYLEHRARGNALWRHHVATAANDPTEQHKAVAAFIKAGGRIEGFRKSYKIWDLAQSASLVIGMLLIAAYVCVNATTALRQSGQASVETAQQTTPTAK